MTGWLDPVRRALDARATALDFFVRDDDAGWADARLFELLDLFESRQMPIDLAVIPAAATPALAGDLSGRIKRGAAIGLHQHGWSHANHQPDGRPCEFGTSRPVAEQARDIASGQQVLQSLFGGHLDPMFTPPWNRCTRETGACLRACGIDAISRDATAGSIATVGLAEIPIRVDWFARRKGARLSLGEWADDLAAMVSAVEPLGLMLHHAQMNEEEQRACALVLDVMTGHPRVRPLLMREAAGIALETRRKPCPHSSARRC